MKNYLVVIMIGLVILISQSYFELPLKEISDIRQSKYLYLEFHDAHCSHSEEEHHVLYRALSLSKELTPKNRSGSEIFIDALQEILEYQPRIDNQTSNLYWTNLTLTRPFLLIVGLTPNIFLKTINLRC